MNQPGPLTKIAEPILEMRSIGKRFPGVVALHDVDLKVGAGEVLGLIGENGAGKSTLMKILSGAYQADNGDIVVGGEKIARPTPQRMLELGIAVIYQEMMLAPHLTVAENLCLGRACRKTALASSTGLQQGSRVLRRWRGSSSMSTPAHGSTH
jgi:ribose transport system ATP-binding protein